MVTTRRQTGKRNSTLNKNKKTPKKAASKHTNVTLTHTDDWITKANNAFANSNDLPDKHKQASKHTKLHENSRVELMDNFFGHIADKQAQILGPFYGKWVYHPVFYGWDPNLILMLVGTSTSLALSTLASSTLSCWILAARTKCGNYYQPSS